MGASDFGMMDDNFTDITEFFKFAVEFQVGVMEHDVCCWELCSFYKYRKILGNKEYPFHNHHHRSKNRFSLHHIQSHFGLGIDNEIFVSI